MISCSMEALLIYFIKVAFLASSIDETTVTACTFVQHWSGVPELIYVQAHVEENSTQTRQPLTVGCSGGQQKQCIHTTCLIVCFIILMCRSSHEVALQLFAALLKRFYKLFYESAADVYAYTGIYMIHGRTEFEVLEGPPTVGFERERRGVSRSNVTLPDAR